MKGEGSGEKMRLKPIRIISKNLDNENGGEEEAILLSPSSRIFHESSTNIYILAIMGWRVPIDVESIKAELQGKRFSSLQVMDESDCSGEMRWVPTTVNLDDHIIVPQLKQIVDNNNMEEDNDKFVEEYISNLSTTSIDMSKPLWDIHILNIKTSHAEETSVLRMHHSIGDGVALVSCLLSCFRTISNPTSLPTLPVSSFSSKNKSNLSQSNNRIKVWSWLIWQYLVKLWFLFKILFNTVMDVLLDIATTLFLKDSELPFTSTKGFNASTRQRFICRTVSLDDIKLIKNVTNTTVNNVLPGITQAALSRYINRRYEVEGTRNFLLERMRCRATVMVNLRAALGVQL